MADTTRQRLEKRINNINKREKKRGTPQAKIDRQTKLYRDQLAKLPTRVSPAPGKPKPVVKPKPIVNKGSKPIAKSRNQTVIEKELARQREIKADPKGYAAKRKAEALKRRKIREAKKRVIKQKQTLSKSGKEMGKAIGKDIKQRETLPIKIQKSGEDMGRAIGKNIKQKQTLSKSGKDTGKAIGKNIKQRQTLYKSGKEMGKAIGKDIKQKQDKNPIDKTKVSKPIIKKTLATRPIKKKPIIETADQANKRIRLSKARPTNKPPKKAIVSKRTQQEKDAGAGKFTGGGRTQQEKDAGAGKFTAKKSTKKSTSLPPLLNNSIAKEIIKSHGGEPAFKDKTNISSKIGRALGDKSNATQKMNNVVYNKLADEYNNDSGQMSEARKNLYFKMKNAKSGGQVRKRKGGMIKRNMGGPAKPRKKTVFRRGGGKALRGFGNATYSNKLY